MAHIVFVVSEAAPLIKTGGLGDVAGSLPRALMALGHQVRVILPYYRGHILDKGFHPEPTNQVIDMWLDGRPWRCPLHKLRLQGLDFLLVEEDSLFDRQGIYGPPGGAFEDNPLRFLLFNRVALEAAARTGGRVDIIHCHDWQTGMIPLLLRSQYQHLPPIAKARTVFTIHNLAYQGIFPADWIDRLGLPSDDFHPEGYEFHHHINCMKAGIFAADAITTVSPSYAEEILTPEYGCQLDGFLRRHAHKLSGIINGLDTRQWDPRTDPCIAAHFGPSRTAGKKTCKAALQQECGLAIQPATPLLTLVSRLAEQKGIDLVLSKAKSWLASGMQMAVLGSGDPVLEKGLNQLASHHPRQMFFKAGFNESLARKIYAGGDIFLMPSRFEPCGLGQLMAMRYGTVPVVRATGGLKDTVTDYRQNKKDATGFGFDEATSRALDETLQAAVSLYQRPNVWARVRGNCLRRDFSWESSARKYDALYDRLCSQ